MLKSCSLLKHRLIIALLYGRGLRCSEIQYLERGMLHIHQGKGAKDRCVPLGKILWRSIRLYISATVTEDYLFENHSGDAYKRAGIS